MFFFDCLLVEAYLILSSQKKILPSDCQTDGCRFALLHSKKRWMFAPQQQENDSNNKDQVHGVLKKRRSNKQRCIYSNFVNIKQLTHQGSKNIMVVFCHHPHGQGLQGEKDGN